MGHYYSEMMSDAEVKSLEQKRADNEARIKAGYEVVYASYYDDRFACPHCGALVISWKKHEKFHKGSK